MKIFAQCNRINFIIGGLLCEPPFISVIKERDMAEFLKEDVRVVRSKPFKPLKGYEDEEYIYRFYPF